MGLQGIRPRDHYGPRDLLPGCYGRLPQNRAYDKHADGPRGDEALPVEWAVLCPNRIGERRIAAGCQNTMILSRAIGMSYQRLKRIETGRVIVRESEYELVADHLGIDVDDLKLPVLTLAETREWNRLWGPKKLIEEGGDHDSVILSAYVRLLVSRSEQNRKQITEAMGLNTNVLAAIWYAEKPIDRYSDKTMTVVMKLSDAETWDEVVTTSLDLYDEGLLSAEIAEVRQPRIRYAPEDPDRRAPWTFETDPLRPRERRRPVATAVSAVPLPGYKHERDKAARRAEKQRLRDEARSQMRALIDQARTASPEMLLQVFPHERYGAGLLQEADLGLVRTYIARALVVRFCTTQYQRNIAAELLGISRERVRQLTIADGQHIFLAPTSMTKMTKRISH